MSTYSWSYKAADHQLSSAKRAKSEEDCPDSNVVCQIKRDQVGLQSSSSLNNDTPTPVTPKRLNWRAKIYVGNLNKKTNEASLAYYFSVFGDIDDIKLIRDHGTKESRGFAFITFEKIESAEKAKKWCSFNYPTLDDNSITVASAERKSHKIKNPKDEQRAKRDPSKTLFWEFKWSNTSDAQVYGPYETSLMQAWKNQGYFDRGCWVRQVLHGHVSRVEEKHESQKNISNLNHGEDQQYVEGNISDVKNESYEEVPCKKPKVLIEYSDSEDECDDDDDKKVVNRVVDGSNVLQGCNDGYEELQEGDKTNDPSLNEEHSEGKQTVCDKVLQEHKEGKDSTEKRNDSSLNKERENSSQPNDVKQNDPTSDNRSELHENSQNSDSSLEVKDVEEVNRSVLQQQDEDLRESKNEKEEDFNVSKMRVEMKKGNGERTEQAIIPERVDIGKKMKDYGGSLNKEIQSQDERNENASNEDNVQENDNEQSISNTADEKLDILKMYEQESTVLSEYDKESDRKINDEDLRLSDYSSSEDEDFEPDDDKISTEFVAVTEIDFNLYP